MTQLPSNVGGIPGKVGAIPSWGCSSDVEPLPNCSACGSAWPDALAVSIVGWRAMSTGTAPSQQLDIYSGRTHICTRYNPISGQPLAGVARCWYLGPVIKTIQGDQGIDPDSPPEIVECRATSPPSTIKICAGCTIDRATFGGLQVSWGYYAVKANTLSLSNPTEPPTWTSNPGAGGGAIADTNSCLNFSASTTGAGAAFQNTCYDGFSVRLYDQGGSNSVNAIANP